MSCTNNRFLEMDKTATVLIFHHQKVAFLCEIPGLGQMTGLAWCVNSSGTPQACGGSRPRRTQGAQRQV